jgi:hypothetical protein
VDTYNSFSELCGGTVSDVGRKQSFQTLAAAQSDYDQNTVTWNMSRLATLKSGHTLYIPSDDHGNPHIDVRRKHAKYAKIFIQPEIALDPATRCLLSKVELDETLQLIRDNLMEYRREWNRVHEHNPAAQRAITED